MHTLNDSFYKLWDKYLFHEDVTSAYQQTYHMANLLPILYC